MDLLFGRKTTADVQLRYADISKEDVEFRRELVTSIDPEQRRVTTDAATYDADILVVALGADYDFAAKRPYDLFVGMPVHRAAWVLESCGLAVDGWVPVEKTNLATRFRTSMP